MRTLVYFAVGLTFVLGACATPDEAVNASAPANVDSLTVEKKDSIKKKDIRGEQLFAPKGPTAAPKSKKENM